MAATLSAPPLQTELIESAKAPYITRAWENWLRALVGRAQAAASAIVTLALTAQSASIGLTSAVPVASGLYRVTYRFRVTSAAGVSSSLAVGVTTTEGGVACTQSSADYTGNVTNAPQSGSFLVHTDPSTPLQYFTTYASSPAAAMVYELDLIVEQL
jgi:hypothetical protein